MRAGPQSVPGPRVNHAMQLESSEQQYLNRHYFSGILLHFPAKARHFRFKCPLTSLKGLM